MRPLQSPPGTLGHQFVNKLLTRHCRIAGPCLSHGGPAGAAARRTLAPPHRVGVSPAQGAPEPASAGHGGQDRQMRRPARRTGKGRNRGTASCFSILSCEAFTRKGNEPGGTGFRAQRQAAALTPLGKPMGRNRMAQPSGAAKSALDAGRCGEEVLSMGADLRVRRARRQHGSPNGNGQLSLPVFYPYSPLGENGAPGTIRTSDPQIRSLMLYPAELRARWRGAHIKVGSAWQAS